LINEKRYSEAEDIIHYWLSYYPFSANAHDTFADLYKAKGNRQLELNYRIKALKLAEENKDHRITLFKDALANLEATMDSNDSKLIKVDE